MAFDFSYMNFRETNSNSTNNEPIIKIWNNKTNAKKNSYFFLNKNAVAMLNNAEFVKVGIDTATKKIVITPTKDTRSRRLSLMAGGSATISLKSLIEENDLPNRSFRVGYLQNYAHGGIIFSYDEDEAEENNNQ
jgi:hypothetical protein